MKWAYVLRVVGLLILFTGVTMLLPLAFALVNQDGSAGPLLQTLAAAGALAAPLCLLRNPRPDVIGPREGMAIVTLGWVGAGLVGALPFYFGGTFPSFGDCLFESISGFTTTGASVLTDVEALPSGLLVWRSLTHWLGGMGIIVLSLAILPFLGVGGMQIYKAEVPSPMPDKLKPRIRDTALILWKVYLLFTGIEVLLLVLGGMGFQDALCHSFGTMATGGFSTKNGSIGHYRSVYIDTVILVFMYIAGINFTLHYRAIQGKLGAFWRDQEFRFFLAVVGTLTLLCTLYVHRQGGGGPAQAFRFSAFQVVSIITTTGYATADYELWPPLAQAVLFFCMFLGACAGSTGGGMKCLRIMLVLRHCRQELYRLIHPHAVIQVKFGGTRVATEIMHSVWGFLALYVGLFVVASLLMAALGQDLLTAFSSVAATIGNIGPGFGTVGPTENYAHLPMAAKYLLSFCMLLGRLEIYTVIVLLVPEYWRN